LVRDEFDADTLDLNPINEQNVDGNNELSSNERDEETTEAPVDTGGEGNDSIVAQSLVHVCDIPTSSHIDWMLYYIEEELRAVKSKQINLLKYLNHKEISQIGSVVCDNALMTEEGNPRAMNEVIKKRQMFESLDVVKFFFQDYAV
jgi:hypothetical protein